MSCANVGAGVATRFDEMKVKREGTVQVSHTHACLAEFSSFEWRWCTTVLYEAEKKIACHCTCTCVLDTKNSVSISVWKTNSN